METIKLNGSEREVGTSAARRLRREGNVPCVLYGHGDETLHFSVPELSLHPLIYTSQMRQVEISVADNTYTSILKDIDFDPVSERPRHADFLILKAGEKLTITVPFHVVGTSIGQEDGGDLVRVLPEVEIECLPKDIPSYIEIDVSELKIGDGIHIRDVQVEGIEFRAPADQTIVTVVPPRAEEEIEPVVVEELEELEGEVPAEEGEQEEEDIETSDDKTAAS